MRVLRKKCPTRVISDQIGQVRRDPMAMLPFFGYNVADYFLCIWKHWKTPRNRAKNLMKLEVPRWAAFKIAYSGDRYARLAHNGWVQKAISNKRLADFGLISMLDYYTTRCVTC